MKVLSTKQVAEILEVTHGRVRQLVYRNELPSTLVGGARLIKECDLKRYLKERDKKAVKQTDSEATI